MANGESGANMDHWQERVDLAAAFRWTVRLNMHEAVANHFLWQSMTREPSS